MFKKTKDTFIIILFFLFTFLLTRHYISEKNVIFTNKSRSSYSLTLLESKNNLPLLKNDTSNIIEYKNDLEDFKKKRKKRFWENLLLNENE